MYEEYYKPLKTHGFLSSIKSQNITDKLLEDVLYQCNKNCAFSTYPYFMRNYNSQKAIQKMSSGNCISLSYYIQQLLKKKKIKSYLIPATIPNMYKFEGFLDICHVAVAVPKNKNEIYILDPAFYYIKPLYFNKQANDYPKITQMKNIYRNQIDTIEYHKGILPKKYNYNKYQCVSKSHYIECYYTNNVNDKWKYLLTEIKNPDEAITSFFLPIRKYPWITITDEDYKIKMYIKSSENDHLMIKHYDNKIFDDHISKLTPEILKPYKDIIKAYF